MYKLARRFFLIIFISILAACTPTVPTKIPQRTPIPTKTIAPTAKLTATNIPEATSTAYVAPTTPSPTETQQPETTLTPHRCNQATLMEEVSIPNGTVLTINQGFTKVWRLKNTGSCTWTSDYKLVFVNGDQMDSPYKQLLTKGIIRPGEVGDVSITLVAPASPNTYHGTWTIRDTKGATFGPSNGALDVEITTVLMPQPTDQSQNLPDLYVSQFSTVPVKPIKGQSIHVTIGIYNQGNAEASKFTVLWYGLSTFTVPSCSWDILDSIQPNEGRTLECDFVFQNIYPFDKTSLVIVDPGNQVPESNEGNNEGIISPFGVASH